MKKEEYAEYRKTDYWKRVARLVKERAKWRCQGCNSSLDLEAHHRTYDFLGDDLDHLDELIALCARCHGAIHAKSGPPKEAQPPPPPPVEKRMTKAERRRLRRQAQAGAGPVVKKGRGEVDVAAVDKLMEGLGEEVELTHDLMKMCITVYGGLTNATIRALGIKAPLIAGWRRNLIGTKISKAQFRSAVEGRYIYKSGHL